MRLSVQDDSRNEVIEEALCFASDIKDLVSRVEVKLGQTLGDFERCADALVQSASPAMRAEAERKRVLIYEGCAWIRSELANAKRETARYEKSVEAVGRAAGYPHLLEQAQA